MSALCFLSIKSVGLISKSFRTVLWELPCYAWALDLTLAGACGACSCQSPCWQGREMGKTYQSYLTTPNNSPPTAYGLQKSPFQNFSASTSVSWVMTPELYPTRVRGIACSCCSALQNLGVICVEYWVYSSGYSLTIRSTGVGVVALTCAMLASTFPETRGEILKESSDVPSDKLGKVNETTPLTVSVEDDSGGS